MYLCMYLCMCVCMYVCMDGWMDGCLKLWSLIIWFNIQPCRLIVLLHFIFFVTCDEAITSKFLSKSTIYSVTIFSVVVSFVTSISSLNLAWYVVPTVSCSVPVIIATEMSKLSQASFSVNLFHGVITDSMTEFI